MSKRQKGKAGSEYPPKLPQAMSKCRDCGGTERVPRWAYTKATRPRCSACGGCLEYLGEWYGIKDRGKS